MARSLGKKRPLPKSITGPSPRLRRFGEDWPAASAEDALDELRRRGREMSEEERERYIRQAMQMVDPSRLADRLLARVPELVDAESNDDEQAPAHEVSSVASQESNQVGAELLEDLQIPEDLD